MAPRLRVHAVTIARITVGGLMVGRGGSLAWSGWNQVTVAVPCPCCPSSSSSFNASARL